MNDRMTPLRLRCLAVWVTVTGAGLGLVALLAGDLRPGAGAGFDEVVVAGAAWALCAAAAWASAASAVVALEAARPTVKTPSPVGASSRGVPAPVRALLLRACGVALTGSLAAGVVAPATAHPGSLERPGSSRTQVHRAPAPPAGPVAPARAHHARPTVQVAAPAAAAADRVTTVPGDSLWRVAEAELRAVTGREPSDADVAAYWPRIHATNRVLLGPDPDFVLPGVPLVLPATRSAHPVQTEEQS